jgi:predicted TIM-barrel fold metal-dependent hydrolase
MAMTQVVAGGGIDSGRALGYPVIDSDAHYTEFGPVFTDRFIDTAGELGGGQLRKQLASAPDLRRYLLERTTPVGQAFGSSRWVAQTPEERKDTGTPIPGWGPPHSNPLDMATAVLPALRWERMEEIGIDFSVLYPSSALVYPHIQPSELRQVACRALNIMNADDYRKFQDRMTPAALIPMDTPGEAITELEFAVNELGLKVAMIGHVARPIAAIHRDHPDLFQSAFRLDTFGIDSDHDYDPFWGKCEELKVPLVAHSPAYAVGFRRSPSNYTFNHAGNFGEAGDLLCRSLFLGGVTRRFPALKFQFLECGVGWACVLYGEMLHRWEKRNIGAIRGHVEAARAARPEFIRLLDEHGGPDIREKLGELADGVALQLGSNTGIDDFVACGIERAEDVFELFVPRFFFGCEADDPITPWAFNTKANPLGARLRATLGSDMGHWDVPDMRRIVPEAWEMVDRGLLEEADFRRFTFDHPFELFAGVNPAFFTGTKVEGFAPPLGNDH